MTESGLLSIDGDLLEALCREAAASPRRRMNRNLHDSLESPCQRLLVAMEPESFVPVHRHLSPPKTETFLVVRGRIAVLCFKDSGEIRTVRVLAPSSDCCGVQIPPGCWHTVIALERASVFFETKEGPYRPFAPDDLAPWQPPVTDEPACCEYLETLRAALV